MEASTACCTGDAMALQLLLLRWVLRRSTSQGSSWAPMRGVALLDGCCFALMLARATDAQLARDRVTLASQWVAICGEVDAGLVNAHILVWYCTEESLSVHERRGKPARVSDTVLGKTMAIVERTCFQRTTSSRRVKRFTTTPWHDGHRSGNRSAV